MAQDPDTTLDTQEAAAEEVSAAAPAEPDLAPAASADAGVEAEPEVPAAPAVTPELEALQAKARERDEYLGLAQRAQADFDNYRKRMARENAQASTRGMTRLAKELLPALDHLAIALKAAEQHEGADDVVQGFRIVHGELLSALERVGIQAFSPEGEPFDPTEHEAMAAQPREGAASGTVIEVYQQGYRIDGAVLRPARVVVAA